MPANVQSAKQVRNRMADREGMGADDQVDANEFFLTDDEEDTRNDIKDAMTEDDVLQEDPWVGKNAFENLGSKYKGPASDAPASTTTPSPIPLFPV